MMTYVICFKLLQLLVLNGRSIYAANKNTLSQNFQKNILQESNRLEYLIPKRTSLKHRLPMGDQGFTDFVGHLLEINPIKRLSASEALKHPWLSYPYEPVSA